MFEDLIELEVLYKQIQELCIRHLSQIDYEKEATKTYSEIINTCFNLLKKATYQKNFQKQKDDEDEDYQSQLFNDGYKEGYFQINCDIKELEMLIYNSKARFDIWQSHKNPYASFQVQNKTGTNFMITYSNTLSTFKHIIRMLKQKQNTNETFKEITDYLFKMN